MASFYAPKSSQYQVKDTDEALVVAPSLLRRVVIRAVILGFSGFVFVTAVDIARTEGFGAATWFLVPVFLFSGAGILVGVLPWRAMRVRVDATGIEWSGRGAPHVGHVGWSRVAAIVVEEGTHDTSAEHFQMATRWWLVGARLEDGRVVGILHVQNEARAQRVVAALKRLRGGLGSG